MTNLNTFSITTQVQFDETLMWVSDLYKDVYGSRPRGYNFHTWSFQELTDFVNDLSEENDRQVRDEKAFEQKALKDVMSVGCPDKKTAARWLDQADAFYMYGDDNFYVDHIEKYGWVSKQFELC
jgi:hypothetical protein